MIPHGTQGKADASGHGIAAWPATTLVVLVNAAVGSCVLRARKNSSGHSSKFRMREAGGRFR